MRQAATHRSLPLECSRKLLSKVKDILWLVRPHHPGGRIYLLDSYDPTHHEVLRGDRTTRTLERATQRRPTNTELATYSSTLENMGKALWHTFNRIEAESDSRRTEARQRHQPARNPLQPIQESNWPPHADDSAYE